MRGRAVLALLAATLAGAAGCYLGKAGVTPDGGGQPADAGRYTSAVTGLPCDVATLLASQCVSCHSSPPTGGASVSLLSYEDLTAAAPGYPGQTLADRAVARLQDGTSPMPPGGVPDPNAAGILAAWIAAGYPRGDCSPDGGTNPYGTPPTCSSGRYLRGEEDLEAAMHPGGACISCHRTDGEGEAPTFTVAGTVFPTAHEYDDCVSTMAGRGLVVITDSGGVSHTLTVGASGNFYSEQPIGFPYRAKVVVDGRERAMSSTQTSGDCNSCHTLNGVNGAPGRIMAP